MVNKIFVMGNLGKDAELRFTPAGKSVCNFSIATTKRWTGENGKQESTTWHNIVWWGGKACENLHPYLKKGKTVFVEGEIQTRSYDDKKSGQKKYITEIKADNIQLIGGFDVACEKKEASPKPYQPKEEPQWSDPPKDFMKSVEPTIDDLPF